jgi:rubrerythrin
MPKKMPKGAGVFRNPEYIKLLDNARKTLEKYITTAGPDDANSSAAKRAVRALMSQDDLQFLKVLEKNADNLDPVSLAKRIVSAENSIRKRYSPSPGVEMHHVNSISSWYEKIKNMPTKEAMQANHYVQSKGHILGTDNRLLPITKDIHQGGRDIPTAHSDIIKSVQADRWVVDQGAWKTDRPAAFNADPFEVGDDFIDEAANIQGRLSFHAYDESSP